jgi:hypothetical protein
MAMKCLCYIQERQHHFFGLDCDVEPAVWWPVLFFRGLTTVAAIHLAARQDGSRKYVCAEDCLSCLFFLQLQFGVPS